MKWKTYKGEEIENVEKYVTNFIEDRPNSKWKVYIGCDSHNSSKYTTFATVIVLHETDENGVGKGGHAIYSKDKEQRIKVLFTRLWGEVERVNSAAHELKSLIKKYQVIAELDINNKEEYDSNIALNSAMGYIKGQGFEVNAKPNGINSMVLADKTCR